MEDGGSAQSARDDVEERLQTVIAEFGGVLRGAIARFCPKNLGIDFAEVEQDVRIRLWRALQAEREIRSPASYFYRVAATAAIDAVRRRKARREEQLAEAGEPEADGQELMTGPEESPLRLAERGEIREKLAGALAQLEPSRRRVVGLHLQGFGSAQVGELLGWSEAKARNLIYRGLEDLRQGLRAAGIDIEAD